MVGDAAPVVNALKKLSLLPGGHSLYWIRLIVLLGALMGMISSILVFQLGQARIRPVDAQYWRSLRVWLGRNHRAQMNSAAR